MSWHEGERATVAGGAVIAALSLFLYLGTISTIWDFTNLRMYSKFPLAADFANYWAASRLALSGKPNLAYNLNELYRVQEQTFGTHSRYGSGWYYPPTFLLMVLPLGIFSYIHSLFIWLIITLVLYLIVLSRLSPHPAALPLLLLFPGIFENFILGQNGYLTGALLGGGLLLLGGRPWAAGCLFGLLSYKPHLVILIFPALILGRYWKSLLAALATSLLLIIISLVLFGYQIWLDYFAVMGFPLKELEVGSTSWSIIPTFFAATLSAGFGVKAAYLVQGAVMMIVAAGVAWVWRQPTPPAGRNAVLVVGTLLFTPYAFVYDLAILALPLGWLWEEGRINGRMPGELILLLCGWLLPLASPYLWNAINVFAGKLQIGPVILLALFFLSIVKAKAAMSRIA